MVGTTAAWPPHLRRIAGVLLTVLLLAPVTTAQALDPPALLYREGVSENEATGPWLPLDGAHIAGLGFVVGTRAQAVPPGDTAIFRQLTMLSVPDGHPDQGTAFSTTTCSQQSAPAGSEFVLGLGSFEGPGTYTARLQHNLPSAGATRTACGGGPATTATFTIDPAVPLEVLVQRPVLLDGRDATDFKELVRIPTPIPGGAPETQCALDGVIQPDGSVKGAVMTPILRGPVLGRDIARAGHWSCVGRFRSTLEADPQSTHHTRWSAPVSFDTTVPFRTVATLPDDRRPRFTLAYGGMPKGSEGGVVTVKIRPGLHCPRVPVKTLRARVGPKLAVRFTFTLPEKDKANLATGKRGVDAYGWRFDFRFGGTKLVGAATSRSAASVFPARFQYGNQLLFGQPRAECTRTV